MIIRVVAAAALTAACALPLAPGLAHAQAAQPAAGCATDTTGPTIRGINPAPVSIGLQQEQVRFSLRAWDDCGFSAWSIAPAGDRFGFTASKVSPTVVLPYPSSNSQAGFSTLLTQASDASPQRNSSTMYVAFALQRRTTFAMGNTTFTPPTGTQPLQVRAQLTRINWENRRYEPFGEQLIAVQRQAPDSSTWDFVQWATTDKQGWVRTTHTAPAEGYRGQWRLRYLGNDYSSTTTTEAFTVS